MGNITITNTLTNGSVIDADELNDNFSDITDVTNGNIDGTNISSSAAITCASIAASGAVSGTTLTSSVAIGTAPITVTSTTVCPNLNAATVNGVTISSGLADKTRHIMLLPAGAIIPSTSGCGLTQTNGTNKSYWTCDFDKDADEWCFWNFLVPDAYDSSSVKFDVWCKSTATANDVVFVMTTADVADAATFDAALGTTVTFTAKTVDGSAGDAFVATKTADPGWTTGRLATIKLMRDVSEDSAAADINVIFVLISYEVT